MLEIKNLTYKFNKKVALNKVSCTLNEGVYGLLGPNGSGKTTLMRCITGLYHTEKNIYYENIPATNKNSFSKHIGYLPQKFGMYENLTLKQMLSLISDMKEIEVDQTKAEVERVLELVNLQDEADKKVKALSGGMVRRAGIAQAMLGNPEILLFDEPTTGLDPEERLRFQTVLSQIKEDKTVIVATHIVEDVQSACEKVIIMNNGSVTAIGTRQEIADFAKDKTYILPLSDINSLSQPYYTQKQYADGGVDMLRINSSVKQNAIEVSPTVEDGYICYTKDIR